MEKAGGRLLTYPVTTAGRRKLYTRVLKRNSFRRSDAANSRLVLDGLGLAARVKYGDKLDSCAVTIHKLAQTLLETNQYTVLDGMYIHGPDRKFD
jgi:hypothetical protein